MKSRFGIESTWAIVAPALAFTLSGLLATPLMAAVESAEIVLLIGQGEKREATDTQWQAAAVKQKVPGGAFVRTLANSQLALLMPDRTQIRLNQNSQLQIKSGAETTQWTENAVKLNAGRAWSQARPQTVQGDAGVKVPRVVMETPSATLSIRGTDWEVEVGPDGQTQLVVLGGIVSMANDHGSVEVGAGEAALAQIGKAPVKRVLLNPTSRVQWVSSWLPQPIRWLGDNTGRFADAVRAISQGRYSEAASLLRPTAEHDPVAGLLLADLLVYQGDTDGAARLLAPHAQATDADPRVIALLARVWIRMDRLDEAQRLLDRVIDGATRADQLEPLLARGELAIVQGDAPAARDAYHRALELHPGNAEAWYGLGLVESERENVARARELLGQSLAHDPNLLKAAAELAATESFAGNLTQSQAMLDDILRQDGANYVALTARGINSLKGGKPQEALEDFLRAGVIEPRYARAWLFSGVAFYQLGERDRALQALARAAELDPRDPIPHLWRSIVEADARAFGPSIAAARAAQDRLPYLKSLNQVANNQRGSANLGSALADFGMEEWARQYADESYTPYWAGSHLFLADRYTGKFNKNSELFQGFITDPTVFGASNRESALVATPGHYGRIDLMLERKEWAQSALIGTLNGLVVEPIPVAYFLSADLSDAHARDDDSQARGGNLTLGLGIKPRHDFGVFGFATEARIDATLRTPALPANPFDQREHRADLGLNIKLRPDNQLWLKVGNGSQDNTLTGPYTSQSTADSLNTTFGTNIFVANGLLDRFYSGVTQNDVQFRHGFTHGATAWTWGLEHSRQTRSGQLVTTFDPVRIAITNTLAIRATDLYVSARTEQAATALQLDLYAQRVSVRRVDRNTLEIVPTAQTFVVDDTDVRQVRTELNPRLGFRWKPAVDQTLRLVAQQWRRPASAGQLGPVDTLGIAPNDSLPSAGGMYRRLRLQYDWQHGRNSFLQFFADHETVDNGLAGQRTAISDFELTQLEGLRNRTEVFSPRADIEQTPIFDRGRVRTLGFAVNQLLSQQQTLSARYLWREGRQQGVHAGLQIPYLPRSYLQLGSHWSLADHWLVGTTATFRSTRFRDDSNLDPLGAGWSFGLTTSWESSDKRFAIQAILDNLLTRSRAGLSPDPHLTLRGTLRF